MAALSTVTPPEQMCENARSSLSRGLPQLKLCRPHPTTLCVAAGGPSLADTYKDMSGYIAAVNGSLAFLMDRGVLPDACAVLDPGPQMADIVAADRRVRYLIASICDPSLFDKLKDCHLTIWHPSGQPGLRDLLDELQPDWLMIGGGSTMGVRWLDLGYVCGFRKFHLHGLDSSFRDGATHAYADPTKGRARLTIGGRETTPAFVQQVEDFFAVVSRLQSPQFGCDEIEVFGDGLLQDRWRCSSLA